MEHKYYCYIVECADGTLYTGYTTDPQKRLRAHNSGKGAKYTRTRKPCRLVYTESFGSKSDALKREYFIKHHLTKKQKWELIRKVPQDK